MDATSQRQHCELSCVTFIAPEKRQKCANLPDVMSTSELIRFRAEFEKEQDACGLIKQLKAQWRDSYS